VAVTANCNFRICTAIDEGDLERLAGEGADKTMYWEAFFLSDVFVFILICLL